ncbi:MAG: hypothetical protein AB8B63_10065 [Granulosicoccus sp.]
MSGTIETLTSKVVTEGKGSKAAPPQKPDVDADAQKFLHEKQNSPEGNAGSGKPVDLAGDLAHMSTEERESRRHALRSMLDASQARQQGAQRARRPSFALGEKLLVVSGVYKGTQGVIQDADFINNRVQLQFEEVEDPQWIEFGRVVAAPAKE